MNKGSKFLYLVRNFNENLGIIDGIKRENEVKTIISISDILQTVLFLFSLFIETFDMQIRQKWAASVVLVRPVSKFCLYILAERGFLDLIEIILNVQSSVYQSWHRQQLHSVRFTNPKRTSKRNQRNENEIMYSQSVLCVASLAALVIQSHSVPIIQQSQPSQKKSQCQHQYSLEYPQQSSPWEEILRSGTYSPSISSRHHLRRLRHQLAELSAVIEAHKDDYSSQTFGENYQETNSKLDTVNYREFTIDQSSDDDFAAAYLMFQKLYLASEIVVNDLDYYQMRNYFLWQRVHRLIEHILKNIYPEMRPMNEVRPNEPITGVLPRSIISEHIRCVPHSAYRDIRDFVLLRHVLSTAEHYSRLFVI